MSTHTAIATTAKGVFDAVQVITEDPGPGEILLKVEYASMIAFDTYLTDSGYHINSYPAILGFGASGTVAKVGSDVSDLELGDRVTAFAFAGNKGKAMQEYSIQPRTVCAKIPAALPLASAATIPDNFVTAFYTLFSQLALPLPTFPATISPPHANSPILIYGAGSTAGLYAIQLLHSAGYTQIIAVASSRHHTYLRTLGASSTFDYNNTAKLVQDIASAVGGNGKVQLAMDCITAEETLAAVAEVIDPNGGKVALLLPIKEGASVTGAPGTHMFMEIPEGRNPFPEGVKHIGVQTFKYQRDEYLRDNLMPNILPQLLALGKIQPNRVRLLEDGTLKERVATGLDLLRNNKVSGEKVVVKISM